MTTPASARRRTRSGTTKPSRTTAAKRTTAARPEKKPGTKSGDQHAVTVTIPFDRVASAAGTAVMVPVEAARKVLPAKGGLPIYLGLGALGVLGVLDWPVAVGVGVGYAVLRRGGPLNPAPADGHKGPARSEGGEESA